MAVELFLELLIKRAEEKDRMEKVRQEHDRLPEKFPQVYKYYCSYCLYQTNRKTQPCPRCGKGQLRKTERPEAPDC